MLNIYSLIVLLLMYCQLSISVFNFNSPLKCLFCFLGYFVFPFPLGVIVAYCDWPTLTNRQRWNQALFASYVWNCSNSLIFKVIWYHTAIIILSLNICQGELTWCGGWSTDTVGWLSASEQGQYPVGCPAMTTKCLFKLPYLPGLILWSIDSCSHGSPVLVSPEAQSSSSNGVDLDWLC